MSDAKFTVRGDAVEVVYSDGSAMMAPDGLTLRSPWGTVRFDDDGLHITTKSGVTLHPTEAK